MSDSSATVPLPTPAADWISRRELGRLLGISHQTAYRLDKQGQLRIFEHGSPVGGKRRRFSRLLVDRHLHRRLGEAIARQDQAVQHCERGEQPTAERPTA